MTERRTANSLRRVWWSARTPGRLQRLNRWRRTPITVTRGFWYFRDLVLLVFVTAIVLAGVSVVRDLRGEDCRSANERRADIQNVALQLVGNDRFLIEFVDTFNDGLPDDLKRPLLARYDEQADEIEAAFAPVTCPS